MAHGFLSPQAVTGEGLGIPYKKLFDGIKSLFRKDLRVVNANVKEVRDLIGGKNQAKLPPAATKMLGGFSPKGLLSSSSGLANRSGGLVEKNATDIDLKTGKKLLTPGGPRLQSGGVISSPNPINPDTFLNRAQTGVGSDGEYLTKAQRIADFKAGRQPRQTEGPSITPDSGIDIVAAVNRNTEAIVALSNLTKEQTKEQRSMHNEQQAQSDKLANRALARAEEKQLEKGSDLSGFTKPETFQKLLPGAGGTGGGGGAGGGPGLGIGGKVGAKKVVQAVGKRGAQRVGTRLAAKYGGKAAAKAAGKYGAKAATKMGIKGAAKIGGAAVAKSVGKKIPLVGLGLGAVFAAQRALQGDFVGAGLELASGAASTVPGIGTAGSIGIDAALAARDMGMTPFAQGGIITKPTAGLVGEAGQEGVFPLEGSRGKKTFQMFGEGILEAQKKAKDEFSKIQAAGLKFYFQNQDGFKFFGNILKTLFAPFLAPLEALSGLGGGILNSLLGGSANAATLGFGGGGSFVGGGTGEQNLAAFLSTMEASGTQNQADAFQVMLNRAADAQAGGSMKAYGTSLGDQITAREQFSPLSSAIYGVSADSAAAAKYGPISRALGSSPEERKKRLLEIASQPDGLAALQKLFGGGSASDAAKVLQDFKSGGALSQQSATDIGSMVSFRGYDPEGGYDFRRGAGGNYFFGQGSKGKVGTLSDVSPAASPGSGSLASAAESLRGMSTRDGPGGGSESCVYAVNKVFNKAGMTPPWGGAKDTLSAIKGMKSAGWQQVGFGEAQPGDVWVYDDGATKGHVGIKTSDGKVLSNSSSKASFTWAADQSELLRWYPAAGLTPPGGTFFRPPSTDSVTQPANPIASAPLSAEQKSKMFQNAGMSALSANSLTNTTPGPVPASPAPGTANTGTPIMATSAQVASASAIPSAAPTIINNYYSGGGNQPTGVNPNGVSAGIDMDAAGLSAFQDLKIRSLS
jgi:hypothetical protein